MIFLLRFAFALAVLTGAVFAQTGGMFTEVASLITARSGHTATLLLNGKVLIAGGYAAGFPSPYLATAELFDQAANSFQETATMNVPRARHTATLLADGRVLIAGGFAAAPNAPSASLEIYDPSTGAFTPAGEINGGARQGVSAAVLLNDGKVLIAGINAAALFNPSTGMLEDAGAYADPKPWLVQTATLLTDGTVLLTGCSEMCAGNAAQIYDPQTNIFRAAAGMKWFSNVNRATLLPDGRILIAGSNEYAEPANAEIYDPVTSGFSILPDAPAPHEFSTATLLPGGTVLVAGSQLPGGSGNGSADLFDPSTGMFRLAGKMTTPRHSHTATLLTDGSVLIAGGNNTWPDPTANAELYRPLKTVPAPVLLSLPESRQGAVLHGSTQQVVSPDNPANTGEAIEIFGTGLMNGGVIPPRILIDGLLAEVLWFGDAPGIQGVNQINVRVPRGVRAQGAAPVRMIYLERPSKEVTLAVR